MTKTNKTTKIAAIVLTLAMLLSVFCIAGTASASAATDRVRLYSSNITFTKYGAATYDVYVQTRDNAQNQKVTVHYFYMPSLGWCDAPATYVTTLNDGSKIWKSTFSSFACQYAIKYEADGETIWDNNNGRDYNGSEVIGAAPVAAESLSSMRSLRSYQINAVLQNYAYHKNVFVRYTTDGWNSYSDQALGYSQTNADGTETWTTKINIENIADYSDFEYAICYQVNGTEFWANHFGANYDLNFSIHH